MLSLDKAYSSDKPFLGADALLIYMFYLSSLQPIICYQCQIITLTQSVRVTALYFFISYGTMYLNYNPGRHSTTAASTVFSVLLGGLSWVGSSDRGKDGGWRQTEPGISLHNRPEAPSSVGPSSRLYRGTGWYTL